MSAQSNEITESKTRTVYDKPNRFIHVTYSRLVKWLAKPEMT